MTRTLLWIGVIAGVLLILLSGCAVLGFIALPIETRERLVQKTPQAKITGYLDAVLHRDRQSALGLWELLTPDPDATRGKRMAERREQITDALLALGITEFTVFQPQWWTTCCEPQVTCSARAAGGARIQVQVLDRDGAPSIYTFDVFAREQPYWGDAMGNRSRDWVLRDVYLSDQEPLYWRLVYESNVRWLDALPTPAP